MKLYYFTLALSAAMMFFTFSCVKNKADNLEEKFEVLDQSYDALEEKTKEVQRRLGINVAAFNSLVKSSKNIELKLNTLKENQNTRNSSAVCWAKDRLQEFCSYFKMGEEGRDVAKKLKEIFK